MIAALLYESKIRAVSFIFNFVRMKKKAGVLGLKVKGDRMDICDTFLKRGKELNAFTQLVEELAEHTYVIDMETDQIELLPVLDVKQLKKTFIWGRSEITFQGAFPHCRRFLWRRFKGREEVKRFFWRRRIKAGFLSATMDRCILRRPVFRNRFVPEQRCMEMQFSINP